MPRLKLLFTILFWILSLSDGFSQNLVYNGSFEQYDTCPYSAFQVNFAKYWFSANNGAGGSSEYFNACDNPGSFGIPDNYFTYQFPRTGNGYVGTGCFVYGYIYPHEYREYVEGTLKNSLLPNHQYCASFYVSLSDHMSSYGIDALGLYFTNDSLILHSYECDYVKPQIANDSLNVITDTVNWVKISGTFIAKGGERFFTFGNFKSVNQIDTININGGYHGYAYYLIDDVAVYECDAPVYTANAGGNKEICKNQSITLGTVYNSEYLYWWYDQNKILIDSTAQITVSPAQTTTYYLRVKDFKFDMSWDSVTVTVNENCSSVVFIPNIFSPNCDGANDVFRVRGPEIDSLHLQVYNRWGNMVFETKDINGAWDGTYSGKKCEAGVYAYWVEVTFKNGEKEMKKGDVSLIR